MTYFMAETSSQITLRQYFKKIAEGAGENAQNQTNAYRCE